MDTVVLEDSPLAAYLEGRGEADEKTSNSTRHTTAEPRGFSSFAPRGLPSLTSRLPTISISTTSGGFVHKIKTISALTVTSTLGKEDNERFLEHFRYILIASQLLAEHVGTTAQPRPGDEKTALFDSVQATPAAVNIYGALFSAGVAFALVWLLHWARGDVAIGFRRGRLILVVLALGATAVLIYAFARRQWLQYLRRQAIDTAASFVSSTQVFETSTSTLLALISEIELVSRGYKASAPLNPTQHSSGRSEDRKCVALRSALQHTYATTIPSFQDSVAALRPHLDARDFDRFLDVYDIRTDDLEEAIYQPPDTSAEQSQRLKQLRILQHRLGTLRRVFACALLSLPATGRKADSVRWRAAVVEMEKLTSLLTTLSQNLAKLTEGDESLPSSTPSPPRRTSLSHSSSLTPSVQHALSSQLRRISALTPLTRSLQAKLFLLRDEAARAVAVGPSTDADLARTAASLRAQYNAVGQDLDALTTAWRAGLHALGDDTTLPYSSPLISKQDFRLSRSSSSSRASHAQSPRSSRTRLSILTEADGVDTSAVPRPLFSPRSSALRALNGAPSSAAPNPDSTAAPLSPPITESGDEDAGGSTGRNSAWTGLPQRLNANANAGASADSEDDGEVFEAVALPRQRSTLTRDQRIALAKEERERQAGLKVKRDARGDMMKELKAVITFRPPGVRRRTLAEGATPRVASVPALGLPSWEPGENVR